MRYPENSRTDAVPENTPVRLLHSTTGGGYDFTNLFPVAVTVSDNDTAGLTVTPTILEIVEGTSKTYSIVLNTRPADNVTVGVSRDTGDMRVDPSPDSLTFTTSNWNRPQKVTVHVNDTDTTVTETASATLAHTVTGYVSATPEDDDVTVNIKDNDAPGIAVNPQALTVTEGGSASYTVALSSAPTANVTVTPVKSYETREVTLSPSSVRFTPNNWNREQMVRVSLSEDSDAVTDAAMTLTHTVTGATEYEDLASTAVGSVQVTLEENDTRGVMVNPTSLTIGAGGSGTYRIRLNTEPSDMTTVDVTPPTDVDVTVDPASLQFTTSDWRNEKIVTVTVAADAGSEEEQTVTLRHSASGSDYAGVGISNVTVRIPVEGVPSAPTGLSATASDGRVTLRWSAPSRDGGSAITRYEYRYREDGGSYGGWTTVSGGASATSTTVTGLDNGTAYEFQVRARNDIGPGPESNTASATLAESVPGAPTGLTATGGDGSVTLNWGAPADGGSQILRYEYRYAAAGETYSDWATVSGGTSARSHTETGLTNGTEFGFQVRAVNSVGEGAAASDSAIPGRAPSAPTGLTASAESETITVTWGTPADDGGAAITSYQVRYRMNGGSWRNWMTVEGGANARSYTMTDLTNGIGHEIEVRAVNAIDSGAAASVEATPMEGIDFAHFANGRSSGVTITSDIVLVNVETSAVTPAIYFYDQMGNMIDADSVVDVSGDLEVADNGALTVPMGIAGRGEMTISTNGEGALVTGSVRVFGTGRLGGVLRFDIPSVGVAGVGASEPVSDAIFPARRMAGGINTGAAIRNLSAEPLTVTCNLMQGGEVMDTAIGEVGRRRPCCQVHR